MNALTVVTLERLDGCPIKVGRRRREPLFAVTLSDGSRQVAYPIYVDRRHAAVWVTVTRL